MFQKRLQVSVIAGDTSIKRKAFSFDFWKQSVTRSARRSFFQCGFRPRNERLYRVWNVAIASVAAILLIFPAALIALAVFVTSGRPILYSGTRYGRHKKPFQIYKFRTLMMGAEDVIGAKTVKEDSALATPIGHFLRRTRLDEIPQFYNVLRGDMNILGPRPVRPVIAAKYEDSIPNYHRRFEFRPGMIGQVQIFLPHGASKRIRARYNNILVNRDVNLLGEMGIILFTFWRVIHLMFQPVLRRFSLSHRSKRDAKIEFESQGNNEPSKVLPVKITPSGELILHWQGARPLIAKGTRIRLSKSSHRNAEIFVPVQLNEVRRENAESGQYFDIKAKTETGEFLIERHILKRSFAG